MVSTSGSGLDRIIGDRSINRNRPVDDIIKCEEKNMGIVSQYVASQLLADSKLDYIDFAHDTRLDSEQEYRMGRGITSFLLLTTDCEISPSYIDLLDKKDYKIIAERALEELEKNGIIIRGSYIITIQKDLYEIKRELKEKF